MEDCSTDKRLRLETLCRRQRTVGDRGVGFDQRSCSTPGPVTTWMGDYLQTGKLSLYATNHRGQLSLPSLRGTGKSNVRSDWGRKYIQLSSQINALNVLSFKR